MNKKKVFNPPTSNVIKWVSLFNTLFQRKLPVYAQPKKFFLFFCIKLFLNLHFLSLFISIYCFFYLDPSFFLHKQTTDYFYAFFFDAWKGELVIVVQCICIGCLVVTDILTEGGPASQKNHPRQRHISNNSSLVLPLGLLEIFSFW